MDDGCEAMEEVFTRDDGGGGCVAMFLLACWLAFDFPRPANAAAHREARSVGVRWSLSS